MHNPVPIQRPSPPVVFAETKVGLSSAEIAESLRRLELQMDFVVGAALLQMQGRHEAVGDLSQGLTLWGHRVKDVVEEFKSKYVV